MVFSDPLQSPREAIGHTIIRHIAMGRIAMGRIAMGRIAMGHIAMGHIAMGRIAIRPYVNGTDGARTRNFRRDRAVL